MPPISALIPCIGIGFIVFFFFMMIEDHLGFSKKAKYFLGLASGIFYYHYGSVIFAKLSSIVAYLMTFGLRI